MSRLTSLLFTFLLFAACAPHKLLEKGKPLKAFERAAAQAERNSGVKASTLEALAASYEILQSSDYNQVRRLGNSNSPTRWEKMVDILDRLENRSERVSQIRLKAKRVIRLDQASEPAYAQELITAKREAAAHLLRQGKSLLAIAENGDMLAAREAFAYFEKRDRYAPRNTEVTRLSDRAVYLGTVRVALNTRGRVSDQDLNNLGRATERALSSRWVDVYPLNTQGIAEAHLIAELEIDAPYVGLVERNQQRDRYEKIIDERKKVGVDTAGNPIYQLVQKTLKATVVTRTIFRRSDVSARINILDPKTGSVLKSRSFEGVYVFEDFSSRIKGDRGALAGYCPPNLGRALRSAPSSFSMEDAALEALKCAVPVMNLDRLMQKATFVAR